MLELDNTPTAQCGMCNGSGQSKEHGYDCEHCQGDGWVYVTDTAQRAAQNKGSDMQLSIHNPIHPSIQNTPK